MGPAEEEPLPLELLGGALRLAQVLEAQPRVEAGPDAPGPAQEDVLSLEDAVAGLDPERRSGHDEAPEPREREPLAVAAAGAQLAPQAHEVADLVDRPERAIQPELAPPRLVDEPRSERDVSPLPAQERQRLPAEHHAVRGAQDDGRVGRVELRTADAVDDVGLVALQVEERMSSIPKQGQEDVDGQLDVPPRRAPRRLGNLDSAQVEEGQRAPCRDLGQGGIRPLAQERAVEEASAVDQAILEHVEAREREAIARAAEHAQSPAGGRRARPAAVDREARLQESRPPRARSSPRCCASLMAWMIAPALLQGSAGGAGDHWPPPRGNLPSPALHKERCVYTATSENDPLDMNCGSMQAAFMNPADYRVLDDGALRYYHDLGREVIEEEARGAQPRITETPEWRAHIRCIEAELARRGVQFVPLPLTPLPTRPSVLGPSKAP